ncbi:hypothetical protein GFJ94_11630 [Flavobacterium sp. LMO8]|uniref:hypothetical protein n=1 Tax=Flavobacterium sp. LMO8 TaxID=2654244 RepID=UPI00129100A6|nr:hypothetical protein [Flavobacterium sp. LMO8]MQP25713.1 hypothetical protein [Flavobacterium sp. LMO8]
MENKILMLPFPIQVALLSFLIGTILFLSYFIFPKWDNIIYIGILYVIAALFTNIIVAINLFINFITEPSQRKKIAIQTAIVLANVPIAFVYFSIIIKSITSNSPF